MNSLKVKNPGVFYTNLNGYNPNNPCEKDSYYVSQIGNTCQVFYNSQPQVRQIHNNMSDYNKFETVLLPPFMNCEKNRVQQQAKIKAQKPKKVKVQAAKPKVKVAPKESKEMYSNNFAKLGNYQVNNPCNQQDTLCMKVAQSKSMKFLPAVGYNNNQRIAAFNNSNMTVPPFMDCNVNKSACAGALPTRKKSGFGIAGIY